MQKDKHKTIVQFYVESGGEILAYFPNESWTTIDNGLTKTCYVHIGQHSACHPDYVLKLTKATPEQYEPLKQELESIGYNLTIK